MATCQSWESPYRIESNMGSTPENACAALAVSSANMFGDPKPVFSYSLSGSTCTVEMGEYGQSIGQVVHACDAPEPATGGNTITCGSSCTVSIELTPATPDAERIADMTILWGLFLVVLVVVFCAKQFLKFFESSPHGEN